MEIKVTLKHTVVKSIEKNVLCGGMDLDIN